MTKKSKMILGLASMLGVSAGAAAVSGFAWFTTTKSATVNVTNIGVYSKSSNLAIAFGTGFNCEGQVADGTATIKARSDADIVETFNGDGTTKTFNLKQTPFADDDPSIEIDTVANSDWTISGKTITFTTAPAAGTNNIEVTYHAREVLTDVSSIDGQNVYKPTWVAAHEGIKATAMPVASDGYLYFTLTLSASGDSGLDVFLNSPTITAAASGVAANNTAAANIARVAVVDNTTTRFVLQNTIANNNNRGISATNAAANAGHWDENDDGTPEGWDLSNNADTTVVPTLTTTGSASKNNLSSAPTHSTAAEIMASNYVTSIDAGSSKTIKFVVWLEGTSYNGSGNASGSYAQATDPMGGVFNVNLPLIAF